MAHSFAHKHFALKVYPHTVPWTHLTLSGTTPAQRSAAALDLAIVIMRHRCQGAWKTYGLWRRILSARKSKTPNSATVLTAFIQPGLGTPTAPAPRDHYEGVVGEYLWWTGTLALRKPGVDVLRVEPPGLYPTSPGGDGLVVARTSGDLFFRLWEAKKHAQKAGISATVKKACLQLSEEGARYLAQYTTVAASLPDPQVKAFYGKLVDLWVQASPAAGAGVSVATQVSPKRAFSKMKTHIQPLGSHSGYEGLVVTIPSFSAFADEVREIIWNTL